MPKKKPLSPSAKAHQMDYQRESRAEKRRLGLCSANGCKRERVGNLGTCMAHRNLNRRVVVRLRTGLTLSSGTPIFDRDGRPLGTILRPLSHDELP